MKNTQRYTNLQISIHWISAVLVLVTILLPLCRNLFTDLALVFFVHKSLGLTVFILTIIRIIVVKKQGAPELLDDSHKSQRIISKALQGMIYLLLIIMPLSGYLMSDHSISFFGLINIPALSLPLEMHADMRMLHDCSAFILISFIGLHALAALYHHFCLKDNVLKAMLFSRK